MPIIAFVKNRSSGNYWTANGKKVGAFRFTRDHRNLSIHELKFKTAAEFNAVADELLSTPGNAPIFIRVEPEVAESDAVLAKDADKLRADLAAKDTEILGLKQEVATLDQELDALIERGTSGKPDEKTAAFLAERDDLLEILGPLAQGDETPCDVARRIAGVHAAEPPQSEQGDPAAAQGEAQEAVTETPATDPAHKPIKPTYDELFAKAKQLGIEYRAKPKRALLEADIAAHPRNQG